jgi:hypothetical protein
MRRCWRPRHSNSLCNILLVSFFGPPSPRRSFFFARLVPSTVPLTACESRRCLTMPPLAKLLSTAAGTNAAQTAIATSRPNAAGDDYDAVDNEKRILTLLNAIRMARRSRMSRMRGGRAPPKWESGPGMGTAKDQGTPPIPSLTLFVKPVRRGEAQSSSGTARRAQPRGKEVRSSLLLVLGSGRWPLAS